MKTNFTTLLILLFFTTVGWGQDSLRVCEKGCKLIDETKWEEAIKAFNDCKAQALKENDYYALVKIFGNDGLAQCYIRLNDYEKAIKNFESGIEIINENYDGVSKELDRYYSGIGFCYSSIGNFKKAEEFGLLGLELSRKNYSPEKLSNSLANLAGLYLNMGEYEKAINTGLEALEEFAEMPAEDQSETDVGFITQYNVGAAYNSLANIEKSIEHINQMITIVEKNPAWKKSFLPHGYLLLGENHSAWGEFEIAEEYYRKIIYQLSQLKRGGYLNTIAHYHLGLSLASQGKNEEAVKNFTKAIENAPDYILNDSYLAPSIYTGLTISYASIQDYAKALEYGKIALEKYRFFNKTDDYDYIDLEIELIPIYSSLKQFNHADSAYHRALQSLDASTNNFTNLYSKLYLHKAELLNNQKDKTAAEFYERALKYTCSGFSENSKDEISCLPNTFSEVVETVHKQADFFYTVSESTDDLKRGIRQCKTAINKLEGINEKRKYFNQSSLYFSLSKLCEAGQKNALKLYELNRDKEAIENAFFFADYKKALDLQRALEAAEADSYADIPANLLKKRQKLRRDLFTNETLLTEAIESNDAEGISHYRDEVIFDLNRKNEELNVLIGKYSTTESAAPRLRKATFISDITNSLDKQELLVEFDINEEGQELNIFIIDNKELQLVKVPYENKTTSQIQSFNKLLRKSTMERNNTREKFITLSHDLYQQFIAPIEEEIQGKQRLIIVGDGITNYVPFEVLLPSAESKPFTDLDYLVKNHEISYQYSAAVFVAAHEKSAQENSGLYAFAPVYESSNTSLAINNNTRSIERDSTLRAIDADGNFTPLPLSEKEVNTIADLFRKNGKERIKVDLKSTAIEQNLKSNLEQDYRYIHIAGHSYADLKNPRFSGIACYQENTDSSEDGTLYTGEIYNLAAKADLVTLSSCESGYGKLEKTEGLLGLNRAFIYAGAPNVLFSLWKVYDKVSAEIMVDFYEDTLAGKSYPAALRAAKLKLIEEEATASPHYWSAFMLIGR